MPYSPREQRAIAYISTRNNWKLSLSSKPVIFFLDKAGKTITRKMDELLAEYDNGRREDALAKKRGSNLESPGRRYEW